MHRRALVSGALALAALSRGGLRTALAAQPEGPVDDLRSAAREAWLYGLPLIESARLRAAAIGEAPEAGVRGFNSFLHERAPAGPGLRSFSAPEPDVLYSSAWIHLGGGPARIDIPPTGGRYFSLSVFDLYGDVLETVDGLEAGRRGHDITVIGPPPRVGVAGYSAPVPRMPALHRMVHARGLWVWALARTHLEGPGDLAAAHRLQDRLEIRVKPARSPPRPAPPVPPAAAWNDYFYAVQALIDENPPSRDDAAFFRRIAPLQLGMYGGFEKARFANSQLGRIAEGAAEGAALASQAPQAELADGWLYPRPDLGAYGQDFLYRAQIALTEPGAQRPATVLALRAAAPGGPREFAGEGRYRLALPAPPPADGSWSLTLYEPQPDGRLFLSQNPLGRSFVGAWTPGLKRRPDGAIEILVGRDDPGGEANWLPAPRSGSFALILRAYAPGQALLSGRYRPPPVEAL